VADDNRVDQSALTIGSADHAEDVVPAVQLSRGATNTCAPVSVDAGNGTGDLRASIRRAIADPGAVVAARWPEETGSAWSARAVEQALLAAGWRPPLPSEGEEIGDDVIVHFAGRPVVGRPLSVKVGLEGDQFVELPRDFAVPAPSPLPDSETEWGCRDRHGRVHSVGVENEAQARSMLSMTPVRREVGPWIEVTS
jgi:hypothetical protein